MDFAQKPKLICNGTLHLDKPYQKPTTCPRCGIGTDGPVMGVGKVKYGEMLSFYTVSIQCTHCNECFVALYSYDSSADMQYIMCLPQPSGKELHNGLVELSSRFADMHKQAELAEAAGAFDVAAMGYRAALEILVKEYAIKELSEPVDEVNQKKLAAAIGTYLQQEKLVKTADVVRILGNDRTHFNAEYPQYNFSTLKHYYDIFLSLIAVQYDIKHPPVAR